jgi:hypothetical protein
MLCVFQTPKKPVSHVISGARNFGENSMFEVDERASFYMRLAPEAARKHYVFRDSHSGRAMQFRKLTMGVRPAAELQNLLTTVLARPPPYLAGRVWSHVHVDTVLCGGSQRAVEDMFELLMQRCSDFNVTLNDNPCVTDIGTVKTYCGFTYDSAVKTTEMADKLRSKLVGQRLVRHRNVPRLSQPALLHLTRAV